MQCIEVNQSGAKVNDSHGQSGTCVTVDGNGFFSWTRAIDKCTVDKLMACAATIKKKMILVDDVMTLGKDENIIRILAFL